MNFKIEPIGIVRTNKAAINPSITRAKSISFKGSKQDTQKNTILSFFGCLTIAAMSIYQAFKKGKKLPVGKITNPVNTRTLQAKRHQIKQQFKQAIKEKQLQNLRNNINAKQNELTFSNGIAKKGEELFTGKVKMENGTVRRYKNGQLQSELNLEYGFVSRNVEIVPQKNGKSTIKPINDGFYKVRNQDGTIYFKSDKDGYITKKINKDGSYIIDRHINNSCTKIRQYFSKSGVLNKEKIYKNEGNLLFVTINTYNNSGNIINTKIIRGDRVEIYRDSKEIVNTVTNSHTKKLSDRRYKGLKHPDITTYEFAPDKSKVVVTEKWKNHAGKTIDVYDFRNGKHTHICRPQYMQQRTVETKILEEYETFDWLYKVAQE